MARVEEQQLPLPVLLVLYIRFYVLKFSLCFFIGENNSCHSPSEISVGYHIFEIMSNEKISCVYSVYENYLFSFEFHFEKKSI